MGYTKDTGGPRAGVSCGRTGSVTPSSQASGSITVRYGERGWQWVTSWELRLHPSLWSAGSEGLTAPVNAICPGAESQGGLEWKGNKVLFDHPQLI